jgi:hypothetical protein
MCQRGSVGSSDTVSITACVSMPLINSWNNRCEPYPVLHKHMVETRQLYDIGIKSGAIERDVVMVGVAIGSRTTTGGRCWVFFDILGASLG